MSAANDRSIGEQLVRIIRAEIAAYDRRKDEAVRLRQIADRAVAKADQAADGARNSTPDPLLAGLVGDVNAQAIDKLFPRQQHSHVNFTIGNAEAAAKAANELVRQQQQCAAKTTTRIVAGENPPRHRWWSRKKR